MSEPVVQVAGSFGSPYTHRVEAALRLKGVPYRLALEHTDIASLEYNLVNKKEPVLVHAGRSVAGSRTIVEYVDEAFDGPPLMPADPYERATARFWAQFLDDKFTNTTWLALWADGEVQAASLKEAKDKLALLEQLLQVKGERFFGGDAVGFLDVAACTLTVWLGVLEEVAGVRLVSDEEFPGLCRWAREYTADETVKQCLPDRDQLVAYYAAKKNKFLLMTAAMLPK